MSNAMCEKVSHDVPEFPCDVLMFVDASQSDDMIASHVP